MYYDEIIMGGDNKILKIVFVVLIIAVVAELVYFFTLPKNTPESSDEVVPTAIPTTALEGPINNDLPPAFNYELLNRLSLIPFYPNTTATMILETKNKVVDIQKEKTLVGGVEYPFGIKYEYQKGLEKWVRFSSEEVSKMKVYLDESGGGIKKPANVSDVKSGDTLYVKSTFNPYYNQSDPRHLIEIEMDIIR